jgi:hypothetical protein
VTTTKSIAEAMQLYADGTMVLELDCETAPPAEVREYIEQRQQIFDEEVMAHLAKLPKEAIAHIRLILVELTKRQDAAAKRFAARADSGVAS